MNGLERFDQFLITIVSETGGVEGLLHALFNFLYRRTDFFYEMMPGEKMGFLPGEAERMVNLGLNKVVTIFKTYQNEYFKQHPPKDRKAVQKMLDDLKQKHQTAKTTINRESSTQLTVDSSDDIKTADGHKDAVTHDEKVAAKELGTQEGGPKKTEAQKGSGDGDTKETESKKEGLPKAAKDISTYNGGKTEKYAWSQGITDLTVQVDLPRKTKGKDLDVKITATSISAKYKDGTELISGDFFDAIKPNESTWSIEEGERFMLNLEKAQENIWKTIIKGDQEIDATKVDNTKQLDDFDPETQGALRKIVHEQNRKARGLPTSEEEKQMEMMKKAWNAEGSPFKGTPFDPSSLNMQGGGGSLGFGGNVL